MTVGGDDSRATRSGDQRNPDDAGVEELLTIGRRCAESLGPGPSAAEHGDLLYDDQGLPR